MKKIPRIIAPLLILVCIGTVGMLLLKKWQHEQTIDSPITTSDSPSVSTTTDAVTVLAYPPCRTSEEGYVEFEAESRDEVTEYTCSLILSSNGEVATLQYTPERIIVTNETKILATFTCDGESQFSYDCISGGFRVQLADVTYDGYQDIGITTSCGAYQCTYTYYQYVPREGVFSPISSLVDIMEPTIDASQKTITSYARASGVGDEFVESVFTFTHGGYELTKQCEQSRVDYENPDSDYTYLCKERQGTSMVTTTNKIVKAADLLQ